MTEAEWLACADPTPMLEFLRGKASQRKLRLFAVACCRGVSHLMTDERSRTAVDVAERYADRAAIDGELKAAFIQAQEAYVEASNRYNDMACRVANGTGDETDVERAVLALAWRIGLDENKRCCVRLRDSFGPLPFRPVTIDPAWLTLTVKQIAQAIYDERAFERMPILADALEDAGCTDNADILNHCRQPGEHVKGCWVVDLLLDKM